MKCCFRAFLSIALVISLAGLMPIEVLADTGESEPSNSLIEDNRSGNESNDNAEEQADDSGENEPSALLNENDISLTSSGQAVVGADGGSLIMRDLAPVLSYQTHVSNVGWQDYVEAGRTAGTTGKSLGV